MSERSSPEDFVPALLSEATPSARHNARSRIGRRSQVPSSSVKNSYFSQDGSLMQSSLQMRKTPISRSEVMSASASRLNLSTPVGTPDNNNSPRRSSCALNISGVSHLPELEISELETMYNQDDTECFTYISTEDDVDNFSNKVFDDFRGFYQCYVSENQVFDLLESYEQVCSDFLTLATRAIASSAPNKKGTISQFQKMLTMERNTWRLARCLYQDRLAQQNLDDLMDYQGSRFHDAQIIENLYKRDSEVRQCQLVIDWLERNEADIGEIASKGIVESRVAWENTLHALQRKCKNPNQKQVRPIVNEMDPDAPTRQNLPLHDLDRADENEFFRILFHFIRTGHLEKAQRFSEQCGYFWLSAALDGWRLHSDPNYNAPAMQTLSPTEGNPCRDIWKAHCWKVIEKESLPMYESAIYASLSGNLKGLLPVCCNWEDALWAYTKVLLDTKVDEELQMASQLKRPRLDPPQSSWKPLLNLDQIFQEMKANSSNLVRDQYDSPHHMVQRHIILDTVDDGIKAMYDLVQKEPHLSHHLLRFFAHFVLFLRILGLTDREELCLHILKAYVQVLMNEKKTYLIATYTATLPSEDQIEIYAKFLEGVRERLERQQCLDLALESGLDVQKITRRVVENIRNRQTMSRERENVHLVSETTLEDMEKIEAIDWLTFDPAQRAEAMKQANALIRVFIASQKLDAAEQTMSRLSPDSISIISRHWKRMTGSDELAADESNTCREYLCFQAYLQALEMFNDWFRIFHQGEPKEPSRPQGESVKFTDWVAYEHKSKQYQTDVERWRQSVQATTKVAIDKLYNVLLFPDGGWMVDQSTVSNAAPEARCREQQMALLRRLCIPQVCSLLHKVLHDSAHYKEALQISDIVANERNQLYREFTREEMKNFLLKLRESSLELLDQDLDPLGT